MARAPPAYNRGVARWSEVRGYTLILAHPSGPDRYARVALVRKRTLFGAAFNVREARAEDAARSGKEPASLGLGRMLSWRWLGEGEAEELLSARLRTLEALGYAVAGRGEQAGRGNWDWLRELVDRQLERASAAAEQADAEASDDERGPEHAALRLREAIERLDLEPDALLEGIATILELKLEDLREPGPATLAAVDPEVLAMLLPVWLEHDAADLQEVGRRWLALPAMPYELDQALVARWAEAEGALARALAGRIEREGLALLGPEALQRLAHAAKEPRLRELAVSWRERLPS